MARDLVIRRQDVRSKEELSDEERRVLSELHEKVEQIRLFAPKGPLSMHLNWSGQTIWASWEQTPDEAAFRAILPMVRQLYMTNERINIYKVLNILWKSVPHNEFREYVAHLRIRYTGLLESYDLLNIEVNGKPYPPKEVIGLWFNGDIFHGDSTVSQELKDLRELLGDFPFGLLMDAIFRIVDFADELDRFIQKSLFEPMQ